MLDFLVGKRLVDKYLLYIEEGRTGRVGHNSKGGVTEPRFEAWPNNTGVARVVQLIKHGDSFLNNKVALVLVFEFEQV